MIVCACFASAKTCTAPEPLPMVCQATAVCTRQQFCTNKAVKSCTSDVLQDVAPGTQRNLSIYRKLTFCANVWKFSKLLEMLVAYGCLALENSKVFTMVPIRL